MEARIFFLTNIRARIFFWKSNGRSLNWARWSYITSALWGCLALGWMPYAYNQTLAVLSPQIYILFYELTNSFLSLRRAVIFFLIPRVRLFFFFGWRLEYFFWQISGPEYFFGSQMVAPLIGPDEVILRVPSEAVWHSDGCHMHIIKHWQYWAPRSLAISLIFRRRRLSPLPVSKKMVNWNLWAKDSRMKNMSLSGLRTNTLS